eukprot:TRINITY_DN8448_c0_g2_i2.p1 TRINITY_DN8448_c0_g2~~TRINITY_DN8448_c0_g2_i2.p1  ORF type:complete len:188 (+),score=37.94 TRINITY_DN8448_c0_g2_i2:30-593(+)
MTRSSCRLLVVTLHVSWSHFCFVRMQAQATLHANHSQLLSQTAQLARQAVIKQQELEQRRANVAQTCREHIEKLQTNSSCVDAMMGVLSRAEMEYHSELKQMQTHCARFKMALDGLKRQQEALCSSLSSSQAADNSELIIQNQVQLRAANLTPQVLKQQDQLDAAIQQMSELTAQVDTLAAHDSTVR